MQRVSDEVLLEYSEFNAASNMRLMARELIELRKRCAKYQAERTAAFKLAAELCRLPEDTDDNGTISRHAVMDLIASWRRVIDGKALPKAPE